MNTNYKDFSNHPVNGLMNNNLVWTLTALSEKYENENFIIKPGSSYDFYTADNPEYNKSKYDPDITYRLNSRGFRSDNFNKDNVSDSILVAGCSNTFGLGLPYDIIWGNLLSKKTNSKDFYNLGVVAGSIPVIVNNCFSFIEEFGKPKAIFILFPSIDRGTVFQDFSTDDSYNKRFMIRTSMNHTSDSPHDQQNNVYQKLSLIKTLEVLCNSLGIPFLWSITEEDCDTLIKQTIKDSSYFKNYISIFNFDAPVKDDQHLKQYKKYWDKSRDGVHLGEQFQRIFSNMLYFYYTKDFPEHTIDVSS
jgi:hypothetical protein